jgi:hypothetical protein
MLIDIRPSYIISTLILFVHLKQVTEGRRTNGSLKQIRRRAAVVGNNIVLSNPSHHHCALHNRKEVRMFSGSCISVILDIRARR